MHVRKNTHLSEQAEGYGSAFHDTSDEELSIDIIQLLYRLLDNAKLIIAVALSCALIAGVITFVFITPVYTATAKLYVMSSGDSAINLSDLQMGAYLASDYQEVFQNWHVHERVIQQLDLPYDYEDMYDMLEVVNPSDTRILYISITSEDPHEAKLIADTYAVVAKEFIASTMETREPSLFEEALFPTKPSAPHKLRAVVLSFIAGFVVTCMYVSIRFIIDDRIRTSSDVEDYLSIPVLGIMPMQSPIRNSQKKIRKDSAAK